MMNDNIVYIARGRNIGKTITQRSFADAVLRRAHFLSLAARTPAKCVNTSAQLPAAVVILMPKSPAASLADGTDPTGAATAATTFTGGSNEAS